MSICQIYDLCAETLWLGRYGENGARDIAIDVGRWFTDLGTEGTVVLVNWRPGEDDSPYNPNITIDGSRVVWSPSNIDLAISGRGFAELRYYVGGALAKSKTFRTVIDRTPSEGADPPSASEDWLERMEQAAVDAVEASASAMAAEETAVEAKNTAVEAAETAANAKDVAVQAANTATSSEQIVNAKAAEVLQMTTQAVEAADEATSAAQTATEQATAAGASETNAAESATSAAASASAAGESATAAASSALAAQTAGQTATAKAQEATEAAAEAKASVTAAKASETNAAQSATAASDAQTVAEAARAAAQAARTGAETARTGAESARSGAETAQAAAEQAAASVAASAEQIETNRQDISDVKTDLSHLESDVDIIRAIESGNLTWPLIQRIVQAGNAEKWFKIGNQFDVAWTDSNGTQHTLPFDVVSFGSVIKEGESTETPGMWLQSHYAMEAIQFDQNEAFYVLPDALPAGTYHFTFGTTWGSKDVVNGDSYSFTTTRGYPAGAQFVIGSATSDASSLPDTLSSTWRIRTYESPSDTAPAEVLPLTAGASGVSLGTITSSIKYADSGLNNLQRAGYGYNRWAMSAMRQWLNSGADVGAWWSPQNPFDRAPTQLETYKGFMSGFDADFLGALATIKVTTALNTVSDSVIGTTEDTYDTFFLPSLEQEYIVPQLAGAEGAYWPYWKERLGLDSPQAWYAAGTNENHIRYAYNARTSAQYCRLRSAYRGYASTTWYVYTTGYATGNTATYASRGCPACVIA